MHIASIQLSVTEPQTYRERLHLADQILSGLAAENCRPDLILLPELWGCGFFDFDNYRSCGETLDGPTAQLLGSWAKKLSCDILGGSILERDGDFLYNTSLYFDQLGRLTGSYRKLHLFGYQSREQQLLTPGCSPVVLDTRFGKIGLSTCYDLRFPEQYRLMAEQGAGLFLVVSAWPESRLSHWRLFNQVRALENQCWLVSCNCAGTQKQNRYAGHSMITSPRGEIITEAGSEPCICHGQINLEDVTEYRREFPAFADRIPLQGR